MTVYIVRINTRIQCRKGHKPRCAEQSGRGGVFRERTRCICPLFFSLAFQLILPQSCVADSERCLATLALLAVVNHWCYWRMQLHQSRKQIAPNAGQNVQLTQRVWSSSPPLERQHCWPLAKVSSSSCWSSPILLEITKSIQNRVSKQLTLVSRDDHISGWIVQNIEGDINSKQKSQVFLKSHVH